MPHLTIGNPSITGSSHTLYYETAGNPQSKEKILFIMGLITEGRAWTTTADYFSERDYEIVFYDNRGIGRSTFPSTERCTTKRMARDGLALVDHLGWQEFHVCGVSMGGMIAEEFALLAPERIVSLSLLVTHAGGKTARGKPSDVIRLLHSMFFLRTRHEMIVAAMNRIYHSKTMSDLNSPLYKRLYDLHADRLATRQPLTFYGVLGHFQAVFTHRVDDERLKQIRDAPYPKLVMCGTEDQLVNPINSKILAEKLQPAEYHIIQDAGHGLISEKPEKVNPILQSFIDRASKQRKQRKQSESQSATSVTQQ